MQVPQLRSPNELVEGLVHFGRMIDKIRLHQAGKLPEAYHPHLGRDFDGRCVHFLRVCYRKLVDRVAEGLTDKELVRWAFNEGRRPDDEEIEVWNEFMRKRGWNDPASQRLAERKAENGWQDRADIQTSFQYIDADEGRL